jgi:hypothetical protein
MSMNVQAYGAPARLTLRDYEQASAALNPVAPLQPAQQTLDRYTPSDRAAAANTSSADQLRVAALRRDAAAPGVGATDRAKASTADAVIASARRA